MKKLPYFQEGQGIACHTTDLMQQIEVIANRYIGANPALPYVQRKASLNSLKQSKYGAHLINLNEKFDEGKTGYSIVCGIIYCDVPRDAELHIRSDSPTRVFFGREEVFKSTFWDERLNPPTHTVPIGLTKGNNFFTVVCRRTIAGFGCELSLSRVAIISPFASRKNMAGWVWSEILEEVSNEKIDSIISAAMQDRDESVTGVQWFPDMEADCINRRFYEGSVEDKWWVREGGSAFGYWSYPVGVTLQGLMRSARTLKNPQMADYVQRHIAMCIDGYEEAKKDAEQFGYPGFAAGLVHNFTLDGFGAMASAMLECERDIPRPIHRELSKRFKQNVKDLGYLPNGAYYRKESDTLWADDLYMGTSFLRRNGEIYGDADSLDIAAKQFPAFAELLMIPEENIFSHLYDVGRGLANGVPWGRGNGWVLYSLSELIEVLPEEHSSYNDLMALYHRLCGGYLKLQNKNGFWHQVLNDHDSYEETSCTAMFTYAISKGVRLGWFPDPERYIEAARKGWKAISTLGVDKRGYVFAVCKGSGYSFTREYYKEELFWVINDAHGVGIVLLAACEMVLLEEFIKGS